MIKNEVLLFKHTLLQSKVAWFISYTKLLCCCLGSLFSTLALIINIYDFTEIFPSRQPLVLTSSRKLCIWRTGRWVLIFYLFLVLLSTLPSVRSGLAGKWKWVASPWDEDEESATGHGCRDRQPGPACLDNRSLLILFKKERQAENGRFSDKPAKLFSGTGTPNPHLNMESTHTHACTHTHMHIHTHSHAQACTYTHTEFTF